MVEGRRCGEEAIWETLRQSEHPMETPSAADHVLQRNTLHVILKGIGVILLIFFLHSVHL